MADSKKDISAAIRADVMWFCYAIKTDEVFDTHRNETFMPSKTNEPEQAVLARHFPPPWSVIEHPESFAITDAMDPVLGYVYFEDNPGRKRFCADRGRLDDGLGPIVGRFEWGKQAQTAKDCSEQFYTDLRWPMSAWLLQQCLTPMTRRAWVHPIADLPSLKRIGISHSE
jgi:hypothetical protein